MAVPNFRGPGYGADYGGVLSEGSLGRLKAQTSNRELDVDLLKSAMQNAERVANVSGSGALDRAVVQYGGGDPENPIFGGQYADVMDKIRLDLGRAEIGAKNRSGAGGAGKAPASVLKADTMTIRDKNTGLESVIKTTGMDAMFLQGLVSNQNPQYEVVSMGVPTGIGAVNASPDAGGGERTVEQEFDDGSVLYSDGTVGMRDE
jgi:hypothetical protein